MKIAIHHRKGSFSSHWINYCEQNNINYKVVNCYSYDIIKQLEDCDALMWHHYHASVRDTLFAKQLIFSLEMTGKVVFPDFRSGWHFDDKLGQKYLFEAYNAPLVPSYVFYTKKEAKKWIKETTFPKVFKLRGGAGSENVRLIRNKNEGFRIIRKAFGRGFAQYNAFKNLKERWRKYRAGMTTIMDVFNGFVRLLVPTPFSKVKGRECGYVYFQDFIRDNAYDIRVNYVYDRCFASRRKVRPGDFRASGSGIPDFNMSNILPKVIETAFKVAGEMKLQSAAFDFILQDEKPLIVEVSYGFGLHPEMFKHGYWDADLNYFPGSFNPYGWMVEGVIKSLKLNKIDYQY